MVQLDPDAHGFRRVSRMDSARLPADAKVVFLRDGKTATISLTRQADIIAIATNGKPDAAINMGAPGIAPADEITMVTGGRVAARHASASAARRQYRHRLGAHLARAAGIAARRALDSIEIEPAMAEAARHGLRAARATAVRGSAQPHSFRGREDFLRGRQDAATTSSSPSRRIPGSAASRRLFSDEFYARSCATSTDDGLLVQWVQIYETDLTIVASIIKALSPHFADYEIYATDDANILIVATPRAAAATRRSDLFAIAGDCRGTAPRRSSIDGRHRDCAASAARRMFDALMRHFPCAGEFGLPSVRRSRCAAHAISRTRRAGAELRLAALRRSDVGDLWQTAAGSSHGFARRRNSTSRSARLVPGACGTACSRQRQPRWIAAGELSPDALMPQTLQRSGAPATATAGRGSMRSRSRVTARRGFVPAQEPRPMWAGDASKPLYWPSGGESGDYGSMCSRPWLSVTPPRITDFRLEAAQRPSAQPFGESNPSRRCWRLCHRGEAPDRTRNGCGRSCRRFRTVLMRLVGRDAVALEICRDAESQRGPVPT